MAELIGASNLEPMVAAAVDCLTERGFDSLVVSSGRCINQEISAWNTLARSHCDGIIVHSEALSNEQLSRLISTRKNVVLANLDHKLSGELAAKHLLEMGHKHIGFVAGPSEQYRAQQISEGFCQQINQVSSSKVKLQMLNMADDRCAGAQAMRALLDSENIPSAVFFSSDTMALSAMAECRSKAIRVPADISILGCGDLDEASHPAVSLSTVHYPLTAIGRAAATRVMRMLNTPTDALPAEVEDDSQQPGLIMRKSIDDRSEGASTAEGFGSSISNRERECLQWASQGKTSWETSQILGVTESTVIYHLRNATRKLNATNRVHAVAKALKASII
ncbi:MAG: substrate-binding domain-containing protein [Granulosicoccus sp.]